MVALNGFKVEVEEWTEGSYNCFICEYGAMMQLTFPLAQQPLRCFMGVKRTLIVNMSSSIVDSLPVGRSVLRRYCRWSSHESGIGGRVGC